MIELFLLAVGLASDAFAVLNRPEIAGGYLV
jgi:hypothetical protein